MHNELSIIQKEEILKILEDRFFKNIHRHKDLDFKVIREILEKRNDKLWSLYEMERTGGEPDVIFYDIGNDEYHFVDCVTESPKERRSLCYDDEALNSRKDNKPISSVLSMANEMGIELLDESDYRRLQELGPFDLKTSSWLKTPEKIRKLGGAIFGDYRYGQVFIYHNSAESYYSSRGFRGILKVK